MPVTVTRQGSRSGVTVELEHEILWRSPFKFSTIPELRPGALMRPDQWGCHHVEKSELECCIGELSSLANRQKIIICRSFADLLPICQGSPVTFKTHWHHKAVIHYGRITSNKTFSITSRAWEPAFCRLLSGGEY